MLDHQTLHKTIASIDHVKNLLESAMQGEKVVGASKRKSWYDVDIVEVDMVISELHEAIDYLHEAYGEKHPSIGIVRYTINVIDMGGRVNHQLATTSIRLLEELKRDLQVEGGLV